MHLFDVFPFDSLDGFKCNLWRLRSEAPLPKGPVLLIHGAGVSSNIFNAPNEKNILDALAEDGFDVWLENWRGSTECIPNEWNLDLVAENDHPVAVRKICQLTGYTEIKALIHCQGSTSFMISALKGLVPQVTTVVSNAVSLHPEVSAFSRFKIRYMLPLVRVFISYLDPGWGNKPRDFKGHFFSAFAKLTHWEQDTTVGKLVSFTYGTGFPALWELDNLNLKTREWIRQEFGYVPLSFFEHIKKCIAAGSLVSANGLVNYSQKQPDIDTRFAFFAGKLNKCFKSSSQEHTYTYFNTSRPDFHKLYLYDAYSHLDIFLGKNAYTDIFPSMIYELNN